MIELDKVRGPVCLPWRPVIFHFPRWHVKYNLNFKKVIRDLKDYESFFNINKIPKTFQTPD